MDKVHELSDTEEFVVPCKEITIQIIATIFYLFIYFFFHILLFTSLHVWATTGHLQGKYTQSVFSNGWNRMHPQK
jgi:hypothetical protein